MWELDRKESWTLQNWCFWTVLLEKTLESPLDSKEIQPVHPLKISPSVHGLSLKLVYNVFYRAQILGWMWLDMPISGLPRWFSDEESACQCKRDRRLRLHPWVGKIPWRRKWQPTAVFLPGEFHGQRSLVGPSPLGHRRLGCNLATKQQENDNISFT